MGELEQDIPLLDRLIDRQNQAQLVDLGKSIEQQRRELAELIRKYKQTGDPALKMELQRRLARLTADIGCGPRGPRATYGAIQSDLRQLRELLLEDS